MYGLHSYIPSLGQGPLSWHFFSIQCSLDTLVSFTVLTDHPSAKVFDENALITVQFETIY